MYEITVEKHFDAAHYLRGYQGKCEELHGHRYRVVVKLRAEKLNDIGLAYDFTDVKRHLKEILARFDHTCLNDVADFSEINPSAENIAHVDNEHKGEKRTKGPGHRTLKVVDKEIGKQGEQRQKNRRCYHLVDED